MLQSLHHLLLLLFQTQHPGQLRGQHTQAVLTDLVSVPGTEPKLPKLTGCMQPVLCSLQGSGIDLACFHGSAGCSGSICFPKRLSESLLPTLTLGTAQPCWDHK